jgi:hypothetical protein
MRCPMRMIKLSFVRKTTAPIVGKRLQPESAPPFLFSRGQSPLAYAFGFPSARAAKQALSGGSIGADAFFQLPS